MSPLLGLLTGLKLGNMGIVGAMHGGLCEPVLLLVQDHMSVNFPKSSGVCRILSQYKYHALNTLSHVWPHTRRCQTNQIKSFMDFQINEWGFN